MVDIVSDIVFSATNPLEDDGAVDTEDTDACVVPDFFDHARQFFTTGVPEFRPTRLVLAGQCGAAFMFCIEVVSGAHLFFGDLDMFTVLNDGVHPFEGLQNKSDKQAGQQTLDLMEGIFRGLGSLFCVWMPAELAAAIRPETGELALLGVGKQRVTARAVSRLRQWKTLAYLGSAGLLVAAVSFVIMWAFFAGPAMFGDGHESMSGDKITWTPRVFCVFSLYMISMALVAAVIVHSAIAWLFALKVAAVLAEDTVREIVKNVADDESTKTDDAFFRCVYSPCMELARKQMPLLSSGWGRGCAFACLSCWSFAMSKFCRFLDTVHDPDYIAARGALGPFMLNLVPAMLYSVAPVLVVMDLAVVSTWCDTLRNKINKMNTTSTSVDEADRVYRLTNPLLTCLKDLNTGQGLGFTVRVPLACARPPAVTNGHARLSPASPQLSRRCLVSWSTRKPSTSSGSQLSRRSQRSYRWS